MAAMYGSIVDALHAVDRMLLEVPGSRYLVWRVAHDDPWNVSNMDGKDRAFNGASVPKFRDLMIVDREILNDLGQMVLFAKFGG